MNSPPHDNNFASSRDIRAIAFFLPQFHPIPENDEWWGKGFTEWRNVVQAKPRFEGHYQPHLPADLGFYDLRLPETRNAQAQMAKEYGISGFCYYHYWFNGRRLLERPFEEMVCSGQPDFPFCLCWANENWTRRWDGQEQQILLKQDYSFEDDREHIRCLINYFADDRYIRIQGKPLFLVYRASLLPDPRRTTDIWREEAQACGLGELLLCRVESFRSEHTDPRTLGFDAAVEFQPDGTNLPISMSKKILFEVSKRAGIDQDRLFDYEHVVDAMIGKSKANYCRFPGVTPGWDNSARRKKGACILHGSTPELYEKWLRSVANSVAADRDTEPLIFINAWNEWAEGNHLEPDLRFGRAYLEATKRALAAARP